ncbi:SPOR domain-containing protein [Fodinibius saliphilus]|uniref:SPOR domain-containing protein n=1 Tax=Fodinibius saliphilus TaxID=1920650 RepID=UPI001BB20372|nr:SPOR domain-containing protein [Fodinibius saliphilus]
MKEVINMRLSRLKIFTSLLFATLLISVSLANAQNRDNLPAEYREYTNPEEVVTFDRSTSFKRALDVINDFAQKFRNKIVIDRAQTEGNIGISVPPMHWMDALKLILKVKNRTLLDKKEFYEIVTIQSQQSPAQQAKASGGGGQGEQQGPVATTGTQEVRINAIFFEGNRRALQEIGVDWSTISENVPSSVLGGGDGGSGGGRGGGQGQGSQIPSSEFNGTGPFVQVNSKGAQNVSQEVFNAIVNVGEIGNTGINVQALFSAFEADNLGEILASPTIKVMDGEDGRIQVGQDFSIKQRDIAGNVIEDFFSVGTILEVTPKVIEQNDTTFVHLDIVAERSTAQPDPVSTIINKQQASTQALLLDGEATVIAGLYSTEQSEVRRGIPILKDLPPWFFGLRYLFGYNSSDTQMRELVILLQADLEPTIPERIDEDGDYKDKYEVLQDERQRMRKEIRESQKAKETDAGFDPEELEEDNQDSLEKEVKEQPEMDEQPKTDPSTAEDEEEKVELKEEAEKKEPTIADPEVKTEKVKLDLGGDQNLTADTLDVKMNHQETTQPTAPKSYYIIGGAFKNVGNAEDYRDRLVQQGYGDAVVIRKQGNGWRFVAYNAFEKLDNARRALKDIKEKDSDAWLYRAK